VSDNNLKQKIFLKLLPTSSRLLPLREDYNVPRTIYSREAGAVIDLSSDQGRRANIDQQMLCQSTGNTCSVI